MGTWWACWWPAARGLVIHRGAHLVVHGRTELQPPRSDGHEGRGSLWVVASCKHPRHGVQDPAKHPRVRAHRVQRALVLVVGSRRFNGAPPVAGKTCLKPTFMVSGQTRPQTHFRRGLAKRRECGQIFDLSTFMLMFAAFRSFWRNDTNVDQSSICQHVCWRLQHNC